MNFVAESYFIEYAFTLILSCFIHKHTIVETNYAPVLLMLIVYFDLVDALYKNKFTSAYHLLLILIAPQCLKTQHYPNHMT